MGARRYAECGLFLGARGAIRGRWRPGGRMQVIPRSWADLTARAGVAPRLFTLQSASQKRLGAHRGWSRRETAPLIGSLALQLSTGQRAGHPSSPFPSCHVPGLGGPTMRPRLRVISAGPPPRDRGTTRQRSGLAWPSLVWSDEEIASLRAGLGTLAAMEAGRRRDGAYVRGGLHDVVFCECLSLEFEVGRRGEHLARVIDRGFCSTCTWTPPRDEHPYKGAEESPSLHPRTPVVVSQPSNRRKATHKQTT